VAVSGSISIFNPELVVLGGGVMQAGDIIMNKVREYLPSFTLADPLSRCRLDYAKLGEDAGAIGAAALAFQKTRHVPRSRS
jgi:glucokinase